MAYSTGETAHAGMKITSEKEMTCADIVAEMNLLWAKAKKTHFAFDDEKAAESLISEMRRQHPQLSQSYPIVIRYACQMKQYDTRAFKLWIDKISRAPWKSESEYLDAQADYVALLYKFTNPKADSKSAGEMRKYIRDVLQQEHDEFKSRTDKFNKQVSEEESSNLAKNAKELKEFCALVGTEGMASAGTMRVESDMMCSSQFTEPQSLQISAADNLLEL